MDGGSVLEGALPLHGRGWPRQRQAHVIDSEADEVTEQDLTHVS
jgi:hypothetical protein